jgi:hypothetical protein
LLWIKALLQVADIVRAFLINEALRLFNINLIIKGGTPSTCRHLK